MKNKLLILTLLIVAPSLLFAMPPSTNLGLLKKELTQYYDSGQYYADVASAVKPARAYLKDRIKNNPTHKKLAVVFDIDETLVSGYNSMKKNDFGEPLPYLKKELSHGYEEGIPATNDLYKFAKQNHVAIFLVTGRDDKLRTHTMNNLQHLGLTGWTELYLKPVSDHNKSIVPFKTAMRKKITEQGYDIVLNIGDQYSDLLGGYADQDVKIPNPYYFIS